MDLETSTPILCDFCLQKTQIQILMELESETWIFASWPYSPLLVSFWPKLVQASVSPWGNEDSLSSSWGKFVHLFIKYVLEQDNLMLSWFWRTRHLQQELETEVDGWEWKGSLAVAPGGRSHLERSRGTGEWAATQQADAHRGVVGIGTPASFGTVWLWKGQWIRPEEPRSHNPSTGARDNILVSRRISSKTMMSLGLSLGVISGPSSEEHRKTD